MNDDTRRDDENEPLEYVNREDEGPDDADFDNVQEPEEDAPPPPPPAMARRVGGTGRKSGGGALMGVVAVVVVLLAAWIFWPRGTDLPEDVGELTSVVELPDSTAAPAHRPAEVRSSDVNLGLEAPAIVPERSDAPVEAVAAQTAAAERPAARPAEQPVLTGEPGPDGKWFIQVGAFGNAANAERLADELRDRDFRVETPSNANSTGRVWTYVRIGYFQTRNEADAWLASHADAFRDPPSILHR